MIAFAIGYGLGLLTMIAVIRWLATEERPFHDFQGYE